MPPWASGSFVGDGLGPDWVGSLSLRREKGKPERLERKMRDCSLRPIKGRLVSVIENSGRILWFGPHS